MDQAITTLSPAALAGLIVAYLLAASRIAGPLTNVWASLPKPWAAIIPALVAMLPQLADAFKDVNTWQSFAVSVSSAIALILPGIKPKPPEPTKPEGVLRDVDKTDRIVPPRIPPTGFAIVLLAGLALHQQACAAEKRLPCDESKMRAIDAAYLQEVGKQCLQYASAAECPALPELRAEHSRKLREACP